MAHNTFGLLGRSWQLVTHWMEVQTSRRELAELDDAALHDIGISRAQARFEADRAPWDDRPAMEAGRRSRGVLVGAVRPS